MTDLTDSLITGLRNFTYDEAASVGVHPYTGIALRLKNGNVNTFIAPFIKSRRDGKYKPMPFLIIDKKSSYPVHLVKLGVHNSRLHSVVIDGKESQPVRWFEVDTESVENKILNQAIVDYNNYPVSDFDSVYKKYFNQFNTPSLLFCEYLSVIHLTNEIDLLACAENGSAIENSKFYLLSKDGGYITSLIDVFNKSSIYINHI